MITKKVIHLEEFSKKMWATHGLNWKSSVRTLFRQSTIFLLKRHFAIYGALLYLIAIGIKRYLVFGEERKALKISVTLNKRYEYRIYYYCDRGETTSVVEAWSEVAMSGIARLREGKVHLAHITYTIPFRAFRFSKWKTEAPTLKPPSYIWIKRAHISAAWMQWLRTRASSSSPHLHAQYAPQLRKRVESRSRCREKPVRSLE